MSSVMQQFIAQQHNIQLRMHHMSTLLKVSLPLMLLMQRGRNLMSCLPALGCQAFWHTQTHIHTQTNLIYSIITSMTVQMQAHHSVLLNYRGMQQSIYNTDGKIYEFHYRTTHMTNDNVIQRISTHKMFSTVSEEMSTEVFFLECLSCRSFFISLFSFKKK